jgi:hypothetical protein
VPIVAIVGMILLPKYFRSTDTTWAAVDVVICNQSMLNVAIIATTLPFLHRVLAGLHTGVLDTAMITEHLELSRYDIGYVISHPKTAEPSVKISHPSTSSGRDRANGNSERPASLMLRPAPVADIRSSAAHGARHFARSHGRDPETESTENLAPAFVNDGIMQTWELKIETEDRRSGLSPLLRGWRLWSPFCTASSPHGEQRALPAAVSGQGCAKQIRRSPGRRLILRI